MAFVLPCAAFLSIGPVPLSLIYCEISVPVASRLSSLADDEVRSLLLCYQMLLLSDLWD